MFEPNYTTLKVSQSVLRWDYRTGKLMEERFFFVLITGSDLSALMHVDTLKAVQLPVL